MEYEGNNQRLPQAGEQETIRIRSLLVEVSDVASEELESVQAVAGTMTCKGVQIHVPRMILCQYCKDEGVDVHVRFAGKLQVEPHELRSIS